MARRRAERQEFWRQLVTKQERSGMRVRRFCEQAQVGEHSFYAWRARLRREARVEFALVEPRTAPRIGGGEIEVRLSVSG
jgi:transposase